MIDYLSQQIESKRYLILPKFLLEHLKTHSQIWTIERNKEKEKSKSQELVRHLGRTLYQKKKKHSRIVLFYEIS